MNAATAGADAAAQGHADGPLKKAITRPFLLLFVVGDVLGAGIYALIGEIGGRVGGAIWGAFAVALLLAVFTAFAYAELVTKYPRAAGAALYTNKAFRKPVMTFVVAFEIKQDETVFSAMIGGAALAFYALIGFEDSVNVAEETRNPRRDYPFALFGGLAIAGVIYLAVAILASMVVPTNELAESDGALRLVASTGPLGVDRDVFSVIALFALANGALINMIMASRIVYGMSRESIIPAAFSRVHERRRTPWVAIVL